MRLKALLISSAICGAGLTTGPIFAQESTSPFSATASVGAAAYSNRDMTADGGSSVSAYGALSFAYVTDTPLDILSFEGGFEVTAPEDQPVHNPFAKFGYTRNGANAGLALGATWADVDLSDASNEDDLDVTQGFRTDFGLNAKFRYNTSGLFVPYASVNYAEKQYRDSTTEATDSATLSYSVGSEFVINKITSLDLAYTNREYRPDEGLTTNTDTISLGVRHDRPLGALRGNATFTQADEGERYQISVGRIYEFADGSLDGSIGYSRAISGNSYLIGDISYARDISTGTVIASASRSISEDTDNVENVISKAGVTFQAKINDLSSFSLSANYNQHENTDTGVQTESKVLGASYTRQLLEDTSVNLSVNYRTKSEPTGETDGSAVYLKLTRRF